MIVYMIICVRMPVLDPAVAPRLPTLLSPLWWMCVTHLLISLDLFTGWSP